jgi:hypothetical protein
MSGGLDCSQPGATNTLLRTKQRNRHWLPETTRDVSPLLAKDFLVDGISLPHSSR